MAHFIAMGFMIAAMVRPETEEIDLSALFRAIVLLVSVLYSVAMSDSMLGNHAFKKRYIGTGNGVIGRQAPSMLFSHGAENNPDTASPPEEIENSREKTPQERTILDIFRNPGSFIGQRVVITGMILRDEQLKPHFGGRDFAVYRFQLISEVSSTAPTWRSPSRGNFQKGWKSIVGSRLGAPARPCRIPSAFPSPPSPLRRCFVLAFSFVKWFVT